jgi:hypothetical protein
MQQNMAWKTEKKTFELIQRLAKVPVLEVLCHRPVFDGIFRCLSLRLDHRHVTHRLEGLSWESLAWGAGRGLNLPIFACFRMFFDNL